MEKCPRGTRRMRGRCVPTCGKQWDSSSMSKRKSNLQAFPSVFTFREVRDMPRKSWSDLKKHERRKVTTTQGRILNRCPH